MNPSGQFTNPQKCEMVKISSGQHVARHPGYVKNVHVFFYLGGQWKCLKCSYNHLLATLDVWDVALSCCTFPNLPKGTIGMSGVGD